MGLPRNVRDWPEEALHEVEERIAMRVQHVTRPLTRHEETVLREWAEVLVREDWHARAGLPREVA